MTIPSTPATAGRTPSSSTIPVLRDPKRLFRLLEEVLASGPNPPDPEAFLPWSVDRVLDALGPVLGVRAVGLFAERSDGFVLVHVAGAVAPGLAPRFAADLPGLGHLFAQGLVVDPDPSAPGSLRALGILPARPAAATVLASPYGRHVLFVLLEDPGDVAVVELVLSTVRAVVATRNLQDRWRRTLGEAIEIQRGLLPSSAPSIPGFDVAGRSRTADEVGGDFFDWFPRHDALGIAVGDASGHGLPAALVARDVVAGLRMGLDEATSIEETFARLNRVIHRGVGFSAFVSAIHVEVGLQGDLLYVNAGHPPPLKVGREGSSLLLTGDTVLGLFEDALPRCQVGYLEEGEALVLYTDGLVERRDRDGELFGEDRLAALVAKRLDVPAATLLDDAFAAADEFGHGAPWLDDATLVVVRRLQHPGVPPALRSRHRV